MVFANDMKSLVEGYGLVYCMIIEDGRIFSLILDAILKGWRKSYFCNLSLDCFVNCYINEMFHAHLLTTERV